MPAMMSRVALTGWVARDAGQSRSPVEFVATAFALPERGGPGTMWLGHISVGHMRSHDFDSTAWLNLPVAEAPLAWLCSWWSLTFSKSDLDAILNPTSSNKDLHPLSPPCTDLEILRKFQRHFEQTAAQRYVCEAQSKPTRLVYPQFIHHGLPAPSRYLE